MAEACHLNLKDLNYLMLAGTYIYFPQDQMLQKIEDVLMGESISARTNQLAYYVPARVCVEKWQTFGSEVGMLRIYWYF